MVDLNRPVFLMLKEIAPVQLEFPDTKAKFPLITITEIANIEDYSVEGVERISDITYQIDVWDNGCDIQTCSEIAGKVNAVMTRNLFRRTLGRGFTDPSGLQRKMMYFTTKAMNI